MTSFLHLITFDRKMSETKPEDTVKGDNKEAQTEDLKRKLDENGTGGTPAKRKNVDNKEWLESWKAGSIGFHEGQPNG